MQTNDATTTTTTTHENPLLWSRDYARQLRACVGLLTEDELTHMLDISKHTLQIWRMKGGGPRFVKLGKNVFYTIGDIITWIQYNTMITTSEPVAVIRM